jgi:hypothetical protein
MLVALPSGLHRRPGRQSRNVDHSHPLVHPRKSLAPVLDKQLSAQRDRWNSVLLHETPRGPNSSLVVRGKYWLAFARATDLPQPQADRDFEQRKVGGLHRSSRGLCFVALAGWLRHGVSSSVVSGWESPSDTIYEMTHGLPEAGLIAHRGQAMRRGCPQSWKGHQGDDRSSAITVGTCSLFRCVLWELACRPPSLWPAHPGGRW